MDNLIWLGIAFCLSQSATFSGLNLAVLGISRLHLQAASGAGNADATTVLALRQDSNFLLTTILWGNVAMNVLLTLLSGSVMTGVGAFLFSTVGITLGGEILPQAYFSRHALRVGALLAPVVRMYQFLLYPIAKPSARLLDWMLGAEGIAYIKEKDLREVIKLHMHADESDLSHLEGVGALNFLAFDDLAIAQEGEAVDPASVIELPIGDELPLFPDFVRHAKDPFIRQVHASGQKWIVITDPGGAPRLALNGDAFLRAALLDEGPCNPYAFCHRPLVVEEPTRPLGPILHQLRVEPLNLEDDVVDLDLILLWGSEKRVVTGADLLGRLLRGIATRGPERAAAAAPAEA